MNPPTPDRLAEIEARLKAATPGPWGLSATKDLRRGTVSTKDLEWTICHYEPDDHPARERQGKYATYEFIANAPSDIALLLEIVKIQMIALKEYANDEDYYARPFCAQAVLRKVDALLSGSGG